MGKIKFDRVSQVDEKHSTDFFEIKSSAPAKLATGVAKKVRVFVDLTVGELQELDKMVMERQLESQKVIYRSQVAKEFLLSALRGDK